MAGWTDSGGSRGRGGGGAGGFANRGGANANNMNTRWRERRPQPQPQPQQPQPQPQPPPHQQHQQLQQQHQQQQQQQQHHRQQQHRYRPVNDNDHSSQHPRHPPAEELDRHQGQGGSSTSTRRPRPTRPPQAHPAFTDHKPSPNPSTPNANEPDDKARRNAANFECNVCFDMADDPVVTKCGHLFCWDCLYQWLHVHSNHRECPVCKGQVADDAIIPIYGRGGSAASVHVAPPRPTGARVESSRQQQLQQVAANWPMIDDDEDDDPFDLQEIRLGFEVGSLRDAMMTFIPDDHVDIEQDYDDYTDPYLHNFDEVYGHDLMRLPIFRSADAAEAVIGSSRRHGHHSVFSDDIMDTFFDNTTHQEPDFGYRGGRRQRGRARGTTSADHFNDHIVGMVLGSSLRIEDNSGASYRGTGAGPRHINNTGGSSRPNGGWTERRGRSNRNLNSGGGRGTQNSRRQGANYN